jgi:hypothetical protein
LDWDIFPVITDDCGQPMEKSHLGAILQAIWKKLLGAEVGGKTSFSIVGAMVGALIALIIARIVGVFWWDVKDGGETLSRKLTGAAILWTPIGALIGAALGFIVGMFHGQRIERASEEKRASEEWLLRTEGRMELSQVTYVGPPIDDRELLAQLPANLARLSQQLNGFIQFHGGLHIRGACREPAWHSLRDAWLGEFAYHRLYPDVKPEDVPFGEDCMGDQFLLRAGQVWQLAAETGEVKPKDVSLSEFLRLAQADPLTYLAMQPLLQFHQEGGILEPGRLLAAYPPFCVKEAASGVHLAAVSADERRRFLADFAAQIRDVPDGGKIEFKIVD